jgi:hypothetical protein
MDGVRALVHVPSAAAGDGDPVREITGLDVDEVLALQGFPDDSGAIVYLSGSLVAGHGNPWSDVDLFAITDRGAVGPYVRHAATNASSSHFIAGRRVDYEFWRPGAVRELAERLSAHRLGSGRSTAGATFLHIEEVFIHRLGIGVPVLEAGGLFELQQLFDFQAFAAFQSEESMRHLDVVLEDLCGMREGGDRDTALCVAREALDVTLDAYLHSRGVTDPVAKWRVKHLQALEDTPDHRELEAVWWRLQFPNGAALRAGGEAWQPYVEEVIAFSNRVAARVQG